ncbi:MAG: DNA replication and repair protein RecF [Microgenomates bacterium OLB23]|nr:MAG: DNA replication and repair protein RecF [Microgenomates bacterium OLB23]
MKLTTLRLKNFRNATHIKLDFDPAVTFLVGPNARGKTNILEAIYFLLTGKGIKEDRQEELLSFGTQEADVEGILEDDDMQLLLRIHLTLTTRVEKVFMVNKLRRQRLAYLKESVPCVLFSPALIAIIDGQPSERRTFIDHLISTVDMEYKKRLSNYENALRKRNRIIEKTENLDNLRRELLFWDDYLIQQAEYIVQKRTQVIERMNTHIIHELPFTISYKVNVISHATLEDNFMKQYYQKRTLVGPQRDEYRITYHKDNANIDVHTYASRGEQRLALFWLILQQLHIYVSDLHQDPILLLDDIFSELDQANKHLITTHINLYQTVLTTTEEELAKKENINGRIINI